MLEQDWEKAKLDLSELLTRASIDEYIEVITVPCSVSEYYDDLAARLIQLELRYGDEWSGSWVDGIATYERRVE